MLPSERLLNVGQIFISISSRKKDLQMMAQDILRAISCEPLSSMIESCDL